jgi:hypothetical protein
VQVIKSSTRIAAYNGGLFHYGGGNGCGLWRTLLVEVMVNLTRVAAHDGFIRPLLNRFAGFNDFLEEIAHFEKARSRNDGPAATDIVQVDDTTGNGNDGSDDFRAGGDFRASVRESYRGTKNRGGIENQGGKEKSRG